MKRLTKYLGVFLAGVILASYGVAVLPLQNEAHAALTGVVDTTIFSDNFETGTGQWSVTGNISTTNAISYNGTSSLFVSSNTTIYKHFTVSDLNSPNRDITMRWYPNTSSNLTTVLLLQEGNLSNFYSTALNTAVDMTWNGTHAIFHTYSYADGSIGSTNTSSSVSMNATWHKIQITSNTSRTTVLVDDVAINFGALAYSPIITNGYNQILFTGGTVSSIIRTDDGSNENFTADLTSNAVRYRKDSILPFSASVVDSAFVVMFLEKYDFGMVGHIKIDINGTNAVLAGNSSVTNGVAYNTFSINPSLLVTGNNSIVVYGAGDGTNHVQLQRDTDKNYGTSSSSVDSGATWTYSAQEWMIYLIVTSHNNFNVDNVQVQKENTINTSNLYSRTLAVLPASAADSTAIYRYLLTGNATDLANAETWADAVQAAYNAGTKNLGGLKELSLLAHYDPTRLTLVNNIANLNWTYYINPTTKLPYDAVGANGTATSNATSPQNILLVDAFTTAYLETNNSTYLNYAEQVLNGFYTYARIPTYGTIAIALNTTNGTITDNGSRVADENATFIEMSLFVYDVSGNITRLNQAQNITGQFSNYAYDPTTLMYHYRPSPDAFGYELYAPSMSVALVHLYQATGNSTYLTMAENNYNGFMTRMLRNGLLDHLFLSDGRYGHEPAYLIYDVPRVAGLLYKYTSNQTYLNIADNYTALILDYFYPQNTQAVYTTNYSSASESFGSYAKTVYDADLLSRFILPTSGVTIDWAYGHDLYSKYRGVASSPMDVRFGSDNVTLNSVSGSGNITFGSGITKVTLAAPYNAVWNVPLSQIFPYPPTLPSVTTGTATRTYHASQSYITIPGTLASMGVASSTYVDFNWGYTPALGNNVTMGTATVPASFSSGEIAVNSGQTVYYQISARVGGVVASGGILSLTSLKESDLFVGVQSFGGVLPVLILIIALFASGILVWHGTKQRNWAEASIGLVFIAVLFITYNIVIEAITAILTR